MKVKRQITCKSKRKFEELIKGIGDPPCRECLVQAMNYDEIEYGGVYYLLISNNCDGCIDIDKWIDEGFKFVRNNPNI